MDGEWEREKESWGRLSNVTHSLFSSYTLEITRATQVNRFIRDKRLRLLWKIRN